MIFVFLAAALFAGLGVSIADKTRSPGGPRPEGVAFVGAVVAVAAVAFALWQLAPQNRLLDATGLSLEQISGRPLYPPPFLFGLQAFILTLAVYALSALRGLGRLPAWVADLLVIGAAWVAVTASSDVLIRVQRAAQGDAPDVNLGPFAVALTIGWIWLVARLCASLNRTPAVAPGYLGLFSGTILLILGGDAHAGSFLAPVATAALAGAGLVVFFLSLKRPHLNLGWSATLSMGFLLGVVSAMNLLRNTLPAMMCLALLALGLPLLNVSIVSVRAQLRGQKVEWKGQHVRLDQALAAHGVPPRKIALFHFALGFWLCALAFLTTRWFFTTPPGWLWGIVYFLLLCLLSAGGAILFFSLARVQMQRQPDQHIPERLEAFGVEISPVSMNEALETIENFIREGGPHHVVTSDANAILVSKRDPEYAAIIRRAALVTPDGFGVIWGARLLNLPIYERVTGVDMVTGLCERGAKRGYSIYILGSEEGVAARAAHNLMQRYPGLEVVGTHHGFWRKDGKAAGLSVEEADEKMARQIAQARPTILFVAMGIPMQEKFIAAQMHTLGIPVMMGVGGSFDVYSGKFTRAPQLVQRLGLEWLYRVWVEPSRWKRMGYVPRFMMVALKAWIFGPRKNDNDDAF